MKSKSLLFIIVLFTTFLLYMGLWSELTERIKFNQWDIIGAKGRVTNHNLYSVLYIIGVFFILVLSWLLKLVRNFRSSFLITSIIVLNSSCTSDPEPLPYIDRASETNIESGSTFSSEDNLELIRTSDSLRKVAESELPVACSFEYGEDMDFNKYVIIKLINNTKKVVNSVKLNIKFSSFQNDLGDDTNLELDRRVTIYPGKTKTIRYNTEYTIDNISIVKYSSNGKVKYNSFESFNEEIQRKLKTQFPYLN